MVVVRSLKQYDKEKVLELGRKIFREHDEIPLLQKALYLCVPELSLIAQDDKNILGFTLVCKKMTNIYYGFLDKIPDFLKSGKKTNIFLCHTV